jgi:hypothetical protein
MVGGSAFAESAWRFRAQFKAAARAADALSPPRARFHDGMTSALNSACAVLVIGRCSLPLHALLRPDHPALLGTMLSRRSLVRCSLQRKHFSSDGWLQLLRCSCPYTAAVDSANKDGTLSPPPSPLQSFLFCCRHCASLSRCA